MFLSPKWLQQRQRSQSTKRHCPLVAKCLQCHCISPQFLSKPHRRLIRTIFERASHRSTLFYNYQFAFKMVRIRFLINGECPVTKLEAIHQTRSRLEAIYRDMHSIYNSDTLFPNAFEHHNPFGAHCRWSQNRHTRYRAADNFPGREYLVIAMHSSTFFSAMEELADLDWMALLQAIWD
jgi:hypothetical protein